MSDHRFRQRLLIRHYEWPADVITATLGMEPMAYRTIGERGILPNGQRLERPSRFTAWSVWENRETDPDFFTSALAFLDRIVGANDDFVRSITATGGEVTLIVDLPGDVNIGSVLKTAGVARLAELDVELGVEIFPNSPPGARGRARAAQPLDEPRDTQAGNSRQEEPQS